METDESHTSSLADGNGLFSCRYYQFGDSNDPLCGVLHWIKTHFGNSLSISENDNNHNNTHHTPRSLPHTPPPPLTQRHKPNIGRSREHPSTITIDEECLISSVGCRCWVVCDPMCLYMCIRNGGSSDKWCDVKMEPHHIVPTTPTQTPQVTQIPFYGLRLLLCTW